MTGMDDPIEWVIHPDVVGPFEIRSMVDGELGLSIHLEPRGRSDVSVEVLFEAPVGYRNRNESYLGRLWASLDGKRAPSSCYRWGDSSWVREVRHEAWGLLDEVELTHFSIFTSEDCIDVVTEFEPVVVIHEVTG